MESLNMQFEICYCTEGGFIKLRLKDRWLFFNG